MLIYILGPRVNVQAWLCWMKNLLTTPFWSLMHISEKMFAFFLLVYLVQWLFLGNLKNIIWPIKRIFHERSPKFAIFQGKNILNHQTFRIGSSRLSRRILIFLKLSYLVYDQIWINALLHGWDFVYSTQLNLSKTQSFCNPSWNVSQ
jgi:hypothetical protein